MHDDRLTAADTESVPLPDASLQTVPGVAPLEPQVRVPGYDILRELGRGGMGVVYHARHLALGRLVALKMILSGAYASLEELERFRSEAETLARLQHPGIVQVFEVGEHEGRPYFALEFCSGGSLDVKLQSGPMNPAEAVSLVEAIARATHEAHLAGIVHRDLKPANVLLGTNEAPKVADFGLAKKLDGTGRTRTGAVMGTPSYMAPEQAEGKKEVGTLADVYALGAILYECLAGRPPFRAATAMDTILQVIGDEPAALRRLNPSIPRDLETICHKCLRKRSMERYASAAALADDLGRYHRGEPVLARPVGPAGRGWRWARRNPAVAALLGAGVLVPLLLLAVVLGYNVSLKTERDRAIELKQAAEDARGRTRIALSDMATAAGLEASERKHPEQAVLWFARAAGLSRDDPERETANRVRVQTWLWEAPRPVRAFWHEGEQITALRFHPKGKHLLTRTQSGQVFVYDIASERALAWSVADGGATGAEWSPDGSWLAVRRASDRVELLRFPEGRVEHRLPCAGVRAMVFSPNGRWLAVASAVDVRLWDTRSQSWHEKPIRHAVKGVIFGSKSDRLAIWGVAGRARVFAVPPGDSGKPIFPAVAHIPPRDIPPVLTADDTLVTLTGTTDVACWDGETGTRRWHVTLKPYFGGGSIDGLMAAPTGPRVAVHGYSMGLILDTVTGQVIGRPVHHRNTVQLAFDPVTERDRILTASIDRTLQLWRASTGEPIGPVWTLGMDAALPTFSPDGGLVAIVNPASGLVRLWLAPGSDPRHSFLYHGAGYCNVEMSRDKKLVLTGGAGAWNSDLKGLRVFDVATGEPASPVIPTDGVIAHAVFSPDATTIASVDNVSGVRSDWSKGRLRFWDVRTGKQVGDPLPVACGLAYLYYSPDGKTLVGVFPSLQSVSLFDTVRREVLESFRLDDIPANAQPSVTFTPDGKHFLLSSGQRSVQLRDTRTGDLRTSFAATATARTALEPTGTLVAEWCFTPPQARVWKLATQEQEGPTLAHPDWVFSARFSPDRRRLLTACRDNQARIWDRATGTLVCPPLAHTDEVFDAIFDRDPGRVFTAGRDGSVRAWDVRTGKPLTPGWRVGGGAFSVHLDSSGDWAVADCISSGTFARFSLGDLRRVDPLPLDDLQLLGEIVANKAVHEGGGLVNLTPEEWMNRWRKFRLAQPDYWRLRPF